jgi:hypothetical protein
MSHSIHYWIRSLHRDIGFFLVGLTLVYVLSGLLLIYRDTGFLQTTPVEHGMGQGQHRGHDYVAWVQPFVDLHKANSRSGVHWFTVTYGVLLGFLAISSFWMIKPGSGMYKREVAFAVAGLLFVVGMVVLG